MEVNHETAALDRALADAPRRLAKGGRLAIITFMSLDDRAVKKRFRELTTVEGSRTGFELPDEIKEAEFLDLTRKPIAPSEQEVEENHRSVSAKLRGIERL
jgi:16S rRNA (cytosine1402-N4)-methyltransferase